MRAHRARYSDYSVHNPPTCPRQQRAPHRGLPPQRPLPLAPLLLQLVVSPLSQLVPRLPRLSPPLPPPRLLLWPGPVVPAGQPPPSLTCRRCRCVCAPQALVHSLSEYYRYRALHAMVTVTLTDYPSLHRKHFITRPSRRPQLGGLTRSDRRIAALELAGAALWLLHLSGVLAHQEPERFAADPARSLYSGVVGPFVAVPVARSPPFGIDVQPEREEGTGSVPACGAHAPPTPHALGGSAVPACTHACGPKAGRPACMWAAA